MRRSDALLTTAQVDAAFAVYKRGWSIARLARAGWRAWGFASEASASRSLRHAFRLRGFRLRSTSVAAMLSHPATERPEQRHEWHGEGLCQGRVRNYPKLGASCSRRVLKGARYCSKHDPKRKAERHEQMRIARDARAALPPPPSPPPRA